MHNFVENPIPKTGIFATPENFDSLMVYCERFTGSERLIAVTVATMALNLAHDVVERELLSKTNLTTNF